MAIRDLLLTLIVFSSIPFILKRPYVGVLVWCWLSYMNPHRLTWGFAYAMPWAEIVALTLLFSLLFSEEKKKIPIDGFIIVSAMFVLWMGISTILALHTELAFDAYLDILKMMLLTVITMICMSSQKRIDLLVLVICLSIGFYCIKGGFFTLATGGAHRVYGPPNSFIGENNALALASLMILPLMYYLRNVATRKWERHAWMASILLSGVSILGSQSRGAIIGILALIGYFWKDTKGKLLSAIAIVVLGFLALGFMPESWHARMDTIQNYESDPSALSRIAAWKYSIGVANARLTGGGFQSYSRDNYAKYSSQSVDRAFVAHSIYFEVLASQGWPGLFLFLLIIWLSWQNLSRIARVTRDIPQLHRQHMLSRMLKLSLIAYLSGGTFLSLSFFDLPWHVYAIAFLLKHQVANIISTENLSTTGPANKKPISQNRSPSLSL